MLRRTTPLSAPAVQEGSPGSVSSKRSAEPFDFVVEPPGDCGRLSFQQGQARSTPACNRVRGHKAGIVAEAESLTRTSRRHLKSNQSSNQISRLRRERNAVMKLHALQADFSARACCRV